MENLEMVKENIQIISKLLVDVKYLINGIDMIMENAGIECNIYSEQNPRGKMVHTSVKTILDKDEHEQGLKEFTVD